MTKSDIVNEISTLTGVQKTDVSVCVEAFMKVIKDAMCQEENVYLRGFGTFVVKRRAQKVGRNITKNTSVYVRKVAPLGDPIEVTVRNYELSLRKADAEMIEVQ